MWLLYKLFDQAAYGLMKWIFTVIYIFIFSGYLQTFWLYFMQFLNRFRHCPGRFKELRNSLETQASLSPLNPFLPSLPILPPHSPLPSSFPSHLLLVISSQNSNLSESAGLFSSPILPLLCLSSPLHPAGFSFCFFTGFLAIIFPLSPTTYFVLI